MVDNKENIMILKDLIKEIPFKKIKKRLNVLYPNPERNIKGYSSLYSLLLKKKSIKSSMIINIKFIKDKEFGDYWHIDGSEDGIEYGLDFSSFSQWLGFIVPDVLENKVDFICHVLYEMTFWGFTDKEIKKGIHKLKMAIKEPVVRELKGE